MDNVLKSLDRARVLKIFIGIVIGLNTILILKDLWCLSISVFTLLYLVGTIVPLYAFFEKSQANYVWVFILFAFLSYVFRFGYINSHLEFSDRTSQREISDLTFINDSKLVTYRDELSGEMLSDSFNPEDYYKLKSEFLEGEQHCVLYTDLYKSPTIDYKKSESGFECR